MFVWVVFVPESDIIKSRSFIENIDTVESQYVPGSPGLFMRYKDSIPR